MQVMNERVFLAFRGLAILIHCFPGLGPSERHTQCVLCLLVDQKLALRWTDISREKALFLYSEITADLPHTRRLLHSPRHLPLAYSEVTPLSVQDVPPEWVFWAGVPSPCCTTFQIYVRFTRPPVSVSSLLETFSGPAQDCSMLLNREGGIWKGGWEPQSSEKLMQPEQLELSNVALFVCLFVCKCLFRRKCSFVQEPKPSGRLWTQRLGVPTVLPALYQPAEPPC